MFLSVTWFGGYWDVLEKSYLGFLGFLAVELFVIPRVAATGIVSRAGDETLVVQLCAEIFRVGVRDNFSRVFRCVQKTPNEFVHSDGFRTGDRDRAIHWVGECNIGYGGGDVVRG